VGGSCGWQQTGLRLAVPAASRGALDANIQLQRPVGEAASVIGREEALHLDPSLSIGDDEVIGYEPGAGAADPVATAESLATAVRPAGARIETGTEVQAIAVASGRVTGVQSSKGPIPADTVVTAGAWARPLMLRRGIDPPIFPAISRVCVLRWARPHPP
jgi:glycine/D-amino acid oxidase-like deaminating enzyme